MGRAFHTLVDRHGPAGCFRLAVSLVGNAADAEGRWCRRLSRRLQGPLKGFEGPLIGQDLADPPFSSRRRPSGRRDRGPPARADGRDYRPLERPPKEAGDGFVGTRVFGVGARIDLRPR